MTENNRLKGKIASIPDYAFLGVILVVCLLYRIYYFGFLNPGMVQYNSDSVSYFYAVDLFRGGVDLYRTPLYPYVIKFFQYVSGDHLVRNLIFFSRPCRSCLSSRSISFPNASSAMFMWA